MITVVVPLDGSEFAERAVRPACALAARLENGRVLLVSCTPDDAAVVQAQLEDRAGLFAPVADIDTLVLDDLEPADGILHTVASTPDALLCMATHGRGGLPTAVLGSVAQEVVCRSSEPLVLVGPGCRTALLPRGAGRLLVCSDGSAFSDAIIPAAALGRPWTHRHRPHRSRQRRRRGRTPCSVPRPGHETRDRRPLGVGHSWRYR